MDVSSVETNMTGGKKWLKSPCMIDRQLFLIASASNANIFAYFKLMVPTLKYTDITSVTAAVK